MSFDWSLASAADDLARADCATKVPPNAGSAPSYPTVNQSSIPAETSLVSPQSPESARSVETFTVGLIVGSYNGGGSVDITSKMVVVHLGPLAERFAGPPSFVQHGGRSWWRRAA